MAEFLGEPLTALVARRVACPEWPDCEDDEGRCLACAQADAIITALEDRERLRTAARKVCKAIDLSAVSGDTSTWIRVPGADIQSLESAPEGPR